MDAFYEARQRIAAHLQRHQREKEEREREAEEERKCQKEAEEEEERAENNKPEVISEAKLLVSYILDFIEILSSRGQTDATIFLPLQEHNERSLSLVLNYLEEMQIITELYMHDPYDCRNNHQVLTVDWENVST